MKYLFLLQIAALFAFAMTGCEVVDKFTQFEISYKESVTIPSATNMNLPFNLFTPDVESNSESKFQVNNTGKDLIEEIKLTKLDLTLTDPSNGDFSFLKSIEIYISADGVAEEKIAWKENIPDNVGTYLELETADKDLQEFIKKDEFKLRLNTVTDGVINQDHTIEVGSTFFVDAKVLGL